MRALLLLFSLTLCAACLRQTEFRCMSNDQCNPGGTCQAAGYCSFADTGCTSGQRFGDSAGPFSGECVGEQTGGPDAGTDGPPTDSPPAAACPADYMPLAGGPAGHVYKKAPQNQSWTLQFDYCRGTSARAYLAVPNDATELTGLHTLAGGTFWVGINDRNTEGTFIEAETGGVWANSVPWAAGQPDNAGGGQGEDCVAATATTISDEGCTGGNSNRPAVCECNPP
ncbi:MAG TPA: lectin-like protein [Kofleriaceae bacterium]|nr:lectin-like protein [Kofleriaceae bacterium]